ncbi:hypothetical protein SLEX105133_08435 [Slackia exigua]
MAYTSPPALPAGRRVTVILARAWAPTPSPETFSIVGDAPAGSANVVTFPDSDAAAAVQAGAGEMPNGSPSWPRTEASSV